MRVRETLGVLASSDVIFKKQRVLDQLYPALIQHGMESFSAKDLMRFLARGIPHQIQP